MKKILLLFLLQLLSATTVLAETKNISHLVVFGDSLSDRGTTEYGGFNRYSNGYVWPEYLAKSLCTTCLQDYAWGGAKSNYSNYNGFNWSGVLWQIERYKLNTDPNKTLYIVWVGLNDLIKGDTDGTKIASNIILAIDKLVILGAKNIAVFNLPDITLAPAYNNPSLPEYKKFSPLKSKVKTQIIAFNKALNKLFIDKKEYFLAEHSSINLYFVDFSDIFSHAAKDNSYKNMHTPWIKTYSYPDSHGYMWWDEWHPMTSVHRYIADHAMEAFNKMNMHFINDCSSTN